MKVRELEADLTAGEIQVVEFLLCDESYAMDVARVTSIVESKKITRLPRAPEFVEGIMDLRGETTAVIDPKKLFGLSAAAGGGGDRQILVLDQPKDKQKIGMLVDGVMDVTSFTEEDVDVTDDIDDLDTRGINEKMIKGIIRRQASDGVNLVIWVDIDRVLEIGQSGD